MALQVSTRMVSQNNQDHDHLLIKLMVIYPIHYIFLSNQALCITKIEIRIDSFDDDICSCEGVLYYETMNVMLLPL